MRRVDIGRRLRSHRATARLLTDYRVRTLPRQSSYADLRACLAHARPGTIAIDVGASVGNYAAALSARVGKNGQVLALEPNPVVYSELVRSTWATNVAALNLAASSRSGWATLSVPGSGLEENAQLGSLQPQHANAATTQVRCITLDDLVESRRKVSVIKVDVEGHELDVIRGASEVIARHAPALVIEIEARHTSPDDVYTSVEELLALDYECTALRGSGPLSWGDFDVREHQTRHLSEDGSTILPGHLDEYANNFLFTPK